ncbi:MULTISPECIES: GreA/GreB family elongation factor [Mycobacterium avium complex (MAC)]|uniref:GreA/GreB family elongation factor n=2 Tax=Mycobacterium avium complex (MAC) TaxID=120793 RepID=A0AAW5S9K2_MYCBC|nr:MULTISPECIES: GreA/GreB family elongation factor [Mycobacterium avium complex (MAC)]ETA98188.1 nucleoside diphosphate kinase regulator [Mycobacterium avium 10-5581]ETB41783.1 nucleoside diphosphate kinase regulator [Mycobacterium avium 11-0986]ETB49496.1 nucleoside diphosphate kinase regulator [Mycobacterium avium 10-5560]ATO61073.2 GreA/GreB family elongation factor [Mycobacterium avium subsp. hominissuis]ATO65635.1 GreA/GreB family elongation factor [Mycobacterium avium subsp. hominissuis
MTNKRQSPADAARKNLEAELDRLRQRRDRLEVEVKNDRGMVGDHGDAAEAIQRADELVVLSDRINELDRRLRAGPPDADASATLPGGTEVTLRFADGEVVTMHVISIVEETPVGREGETLTARSPLAQALAGRQPGDTVTYPTPQGEKQVELIAVKLP